MTLDVHCQGEGGEGRVFSGQNKRGTFGNVILSKDGQLGNNN